LAGRLRFRRQADYFFRYSCFFQSALKHRLDMSFFLPAVNCRLGSQAGFGSFLLDKQKK